MTNPQFDYCLELVVVVVEPTVSLPVRRKPTVAGAHDSPSAFVA